MTLRHDLDAPLVNPNYAPRVPMPIPSSSIDAGPSVTMRVNRAWLSHIIGMLETLDQPDAWKGTEYQIESARAQIRELIASAEEETIVNTLPLGLVIPFAGLVAALPDWLLLCDGATHNRADYPDLYAVLESAFVIDADHFKTPDLNGRFPLGASGAVGGIGGAENHTLTVAQMPSHNHEHVGGNSIYQILYTDPPPPQILGRIAGSSPTGGAVVRSFNVANNGGGEAHNNMPPYLALRYYIVAKNA